MNEENKMPDLNVLKSDAPMTTAELEADIMRMQYEVKKHLKPFSKNKLIAMIQQLLFEMHYMKMELENLKKGKEDA